jgi:hypothetical protein
VPQSSVPPQPSGNAPHATPCAAHVVRVQQLPCRQTCPGPQVEAQVPDAASHVWHLAAVQQVLPQTLAVWQHDPSSPKNPSTQTWPAGQGQIPPHVSSLHGGCPPQAGRQHTPPKQTSSPEQPPQSMVPPQPSGRRPQASGGQVSGVQHRPELSGMQQLPSWQTWPSGQPQSSVPPQPSGIAPHAPAGHVASSQQFSW